MGVPRGGNSDFSSSESFLEFQMARFPPAWKMESWGVGPMEQPARPRWLPLRPLMQEASSLQFPANFPDNSHELSPHINTDLGRKLIRIVWHCAAICARCTAGVWSDFSLGMCCDHLGQWARPMQLP